MDKIYLDIPADTELYGILEKQFTPVGSLIAADVIVTDNAYTFIDGKLFIVIGESQSEDVVSIDNNMPPAFIAESVKAAVAGAAVFKKKNAPQTAYHIIGAEESKSEYMINKLHTILNAAPESIVEIDLNGDILFNNIKFSDLYDPGAPVIVANIFRIFDEETSDDIRSKIEKLPRGAAFEFGGRMQRKDGVFINISGHVTDIPGEVRHYEIIFEDITRKLAKILQARKVEEQAIIAGFSRHLSHNILNALTAAGGFIRQVKAKTLDNNLHLQNLWHIIDGKLMLIEEIVSAYNDYTHALSLNPTDKCDISAVYQDLVQSIAEKNFDPRFSAYLYKFTGNYEMTYDFSEAKPFEIRANKLFLKLALCYILKDNIRYFGTEAPLEYKVTLKVQDENFLMLIDVVGIELQDYISETMFKPWNHQVKSQSFDYWGVMVATTVTERHNGRVNVEKTDNGARFILTFLQQPF